MNFTQNNKDYIFQGNTYTCNVWMAALTAMSTVKKVKLKISL